MFKNATLLGFNPKATFAPLPDEMKFTPPSDLELKRSGWAPVRDDVLAYINNGHWLLNFTVEKKHMPAGAVKLVVNEKAAALEEAQGFAPGKKAMKDLKERVIDELLPRALSSRSTTRVWIDRAHGRIVIDSVSNAMIDEVQRALIKTFGDIGLQDVAWPRAKVITEWLEAAPCDFTSDDEVALQYPGERGKVVKYARADLGADDVQAHLKAGASVQTMAMTYNDRISFVMTSDLQVRRIRPLDILKEGDTKDVDKFDNDFVLMTGEMSALFNALAAEA
jgi:recombination associated protein RdgC